MCSIFQTLLNRNYFLERKPVDNRHNAEIDVLNNFLYVVGGKESCNAHRP